MATGNEIWYLQNVDLHQLFCPVSTGINHHLQQFKKGEFIYFPKEQSDKIYFVASGKVKVGSYSDDGKELIKAILGYGEIFGELAIVGESERKDFAQALEPVEVCVKQLEEVHSLMNRDPKFNRRLTIMIGNRLLRTEKKLESLVFKDARTRIVDLLKDMAKKRGKKVGLELLIDNYLTHQDMANLTATSRQTVTTVLNELRESNQIYFDRKRILIRDIETLS